MSRRLNRRDGASETQNHPFRALFDLMLALVLVFAAVVVAQHRALFPIPKAAAKTTPQEKNAESEAIRTLQDELLLLHNVQYRHQHPDDAKQYTNLGDLPGDDSCHVALADVATIPATESSISHSSESPAQTQPKPSAAVPVQDKKLPASNGDPISPPGNAPTATEVTPLASRTYLMLQAHRDALYTELAPYLKDQLLGTRVIRVVGQDELRFASASAVPTDQSQLPHILALIRQRYSEGYHRIRLEGHTDSVAISTVQFPSNWELSAARAIFLAKAIQKDFTARGVTIGAGGITVEAIGYGERSPVASNATEEGRRQNRRIRIVFER